MPKTTSKTVKQKATKSSAKVKPRKKAKTTRKSQPVLKNGDFVTIDYIGRVKETNRVFDTSKEEVAREENIYDENQSYGPQLVVLGEGRYMQGFETRLIGAIIGKQIQFEIPPEEGFGQRDSSKIKIHNIRDFRSQNVKPRVGQRIRMGQRSGTVVRVGGGRVVVDYNSPLAGKVLVYKVWIHDIVKTESEKLKSLISRRTGAELADQFKVKKKATELEIVVPPVTFYSQQIQITKAGIALDLLKHLPKIKKIQFTETHERPKTETSKAKPKKASTKTAKKKAKGKQTKK
jgi:peptidylprolyl isomerase